MGTAQLTVQRTIDKNSQVQKTLNKTKLHRLAIHKLLSGSTNPRASLSQFQDCQDIFLNLKQATFHPELVLPCNVGAYIR